MKKAFTMIELVFVIVVLGILSAIALPKLFGTKTDAQIAQLQSQVKEIRTAIQAYAKQKMLITGNMDEESNFPGNNDGLDFGLNIGKGEANLFGLVLNGADKSKWHLVDGKYYDYLYKIKGYGTFYFAYVPTEGAKKYLIKYPGIDWNIGDFKCYSFKDKNDKVIADMCDKVFGQ